MKYNSNLYSKQSINKFINKEDSEDTLKTTYPASVTLTEIGVSFKIQNIPYTFMFENITKEFKLDLVSIAMDYFAHNYITEDHYQLIKNNQSLEGFNQQGITFTNGDFYIYEDVVLDGSLHTILLDVIKNKPHLLTNYKNFISKTLYNPIGIIFYDGLAKVLAKGLTVDKDGMIHGYIPCTQDYTTYDNKPLVEGVVLTDYSYDFKYIDRGFEIYSKEEALTKDNYCVSVVVDPLYLLDVSVNIISSVAIVGDDIGYK